MLTKIPYCIHYIIVGYFKCDFKFINVKMLRILVEKLLSIGKHILLFSFSYNYYIHFFLRFIVFL